jgi:hypothetical protein
VIEAMPNISRRMVNKRLEFVVRLSTVILIIFAVALVLLQLSVRVGLAVDISTP